MVEYLKKSCKRGKVIIGSCSKNVNKNIIV